MSDNKRRDLDRFQAAINYRFNDEKLLIQALTHRSRGQNNNERLEYLGDSILGFIIAAALYQRFPGLSEGDLTKMRSRLVRGRTLANLARGLNIGQVILLGSGELKSGGNDRESILADAFEAVIGAIYVDSNLEAVSYSLLPLYSDLLDTISPQSLKDNKTKLQEILQKNNQALPVYEVTEQTGEQHNLMFTVSCAIAGFEQPFTATGSSRRFAEQAAAELAIQRLTAK